MKPSPDSQDFLATILWINEGDTDTSIDEGATVFDFSEPFISALNEFLDDVRDRMEDTHLDELDQCARSFGGNVYLSLSGHGAGFFDEYPVDGKALQNRLEEISANRYRFEELSYSLAYDDDHKIDLAIIPSHIDEYRADLFRLAD